MGKVDLYWMSNRDWWEVHNFVITLKEDAQKKRRSAMTDIFFRKDWIVFMSYLAIKTSFYE